MTELNSDVLSWHVMTSCTWRASREGEEDKIGGTPACGRFCWLGSKDELELPVLYEYSCGYWRLLALRLASFEIR